jgi:putative flippase GtrA
LFSKLRALIIAIIDFVHKPFSKWIPAQTFRYLACGGGNTLLGIVLFSIIYNLVFNGKDVTVGFVDFSFIQKLVAYITRNGRFEFLDDVQIGSRVATMAMTMSVNVPIGFLLSSYVVFPESQIHSRVQLFRYLTATLTFALLTYVLTRTFEIMLPVVRGDIANIFVTAIIAVLSYLSQRFYTFKITPESDAGDEETGLPN